MPLQRFRINRVDKNAQHYYLFRVQHPAYTSWGPGHVPPPQRELNLCLCLADDQSAYKWSPVYDFTGVQGVFAFVGAGGGVFHFPLSQLKPYHPDLLSHYLEKINATWPQEPNVYSCPAFRYVEPFPAEF